MTLQERLRDFLIETKTGGYGALPPSSLIREAVDRIDQLEAALKQIAGRFVVHQGAAGYNGHTRVGEIYEIAIAALAAPAKGSKG